ncbi:glycosyltransferase, partial [Clostridium neonatale]
MKKVNKLFTPSESSKKIFQEYYMELYNEQLLDIEVVEHGVDKGLVKENIVHLKKDKFKIAFIGGLSLNKGSGIIHSLITSNKNKNIEWHLFGNIGDQRLNLLERIDVVKHGRYNRDDIAKILNDNCINLICIFSIWPETYSYTLSEAINSRIPILVTEIGALGERIKKYDIGWTVPYNDDKRDILENI